MTLQAPNRHTCCARCYGRDGEHEGWCPYGRILSHIRPIWREWMAARLARLDERALARIMQIILANGSGEETEQKEEKVA